ncbi:MAG: carboxylesterase family protein [Clostridia bacterium]|nr:carboxylesterase family protein [Clostridia bacterium]
MNTEKIKTSLGSIKGERLEDVLAFRGIKYASAERFAEPVMTTTLGDEYDATKFKDACIQATTYGLQKDGLYKKEFPSDALTYSEDCLNLNIYAPINAKNCPVVMMIHGGSFSTGANSKPQINSLEYPKRGVIYVSINYRLNIFGFFAKTGIPKNLGLQDQLCAIKFIHKYISEFGGDPNNITLQGQSAGAMCIMSLANAGAISPYVKRLILRSGGGNFSLLFKPRKPKVIEKYYDKQYKDYSIDQLKQMDAKDLYMLWKHNENIKGSYYCFPVEDNIFSSGKPQFNFDVMIGTVKLDMVNKLLKSTATKFAKQQSKHQKQCFVYEFNHPLPGEIPYFHSADEWYFLGSMKNGWRNFSEKDYAIKDELIDRVVSFVKTSKPNLDNYKIWNSFNTSKDILKIE